MEGINGREPQTKDSLGRNRFQILSEQSQGIVARKISGNAPFTADSSSIEEAGKHLQTDFSILKNIVESSNNGIFSIDRNYCYTCFNSSYASFIKSFYGTEIGLGKSALDCYASETDKETAREILDRVLDGSSFGVGSWAGTDPVTRHYFFNTFNAIKDENEKIIGAVIFTNDVTEHQRVFDALLESEEFSSALMQNAPNPVLVVNKDTSIRYVNPAFEKLTGFTSAELVGKKSPYPWWPEKHISQYMDVYLDIHQNGINSIERLQKNKNNEPFWVSLTVQKIKNNGEIKYYLVNWVDITAQKKAQNEIIHSHEQLRHFSYYLQEKLEEERKHISKEIHDELGQMLTALKIDLSWLAKRLPPESDLLLQKTKAMTALVDDTEKVVKRVSADLRPPILDDLGLTEAIRWLLAQFQARTGVKCFLTIPENIMLGRKHDVDIFRIVQEALTNVARHAAASRVWVSIKNSTGYLTVKIKDNGRGITELELSNSRSYGLIGMQERALMLEGSLKIEGVKGKGTIITLNFPIKE